MIVAGIVLAGGRSRRMGGGDKCLRPVQGRPMLAHIVERARGQVAALALNANGDPRRFAEFGLPVIADSIADFAGPLAGVLAGLDWAAAAIAGCSHVATFPGDAPFLPHDLVRQLAAALADGHYDLACASAAGRAHPVFGLWPVGLREDLRAAVTEEGLRKVDLWTARHRRVTVEFSARPIDPFFNANRPEDVAEAERLASIGDAPAQ
jgi:molybdenum cofactor guanylyltransferase